MPENPNSDREARKERVKNATNPIISMQSHNKPVDELYREEPKPLDTNRDQEVAKVVNKGINGRLTPPGRRI